MTEEASRRNKLTGIIWIFTGLMTLFSFSNLLKIEIDGEPVTLSGIAVIIGIVAFFVTRGTNDSKAEGLDIKSFPKKLADIRVIILLLIPSIINVVTSFATDPLIPGYAEHLEARTSALDPESLASMVITLIAAALGEEISSRAFLQKQLTKAWGIIPSVVITSLIFAFAHFN